MSRADFTLENLGGGIARIMLHRAPVNALTPSFLDGLSDAYDQIANDPDVRAVILASGQKVLSGGLDLKAAQGFSQADEWDIVRGLNQSFAKLYALPKPTICAVNGAAIAGGFFFVLGSDYRIGDTRASVGLAEVRVGATLPAGPEAIAKAELHPNDLRKLLLNGEPYNAEQALAAGILDAVVEPDALMETALKAAEKYAALPPKTYAVAKSQLRRDTVQAIETAMKNGANTPEGGWFSDETKPAMQAMVGPA
ncbi:enoyl-CoA hydratase/isomerase family protein [Amylibacter sp. IMCC11727]|uniref:enoyl-CoA hydratase/isomerase family protein n=1 Tax=Amylibacter sp. IMCC11727 TaxID=3039851 RepID=UPI00244DE298|nr:enoyl-CoA hydratase/isomerase family protein [Amylibacter sp. IMCC11727]WGI23206.1 enoyl-CoA hydratase/isomerase family protein [Amylibacter sp. IMCC11727]